MKRITIAGILLIALVAVSVGVAADEPEQTIEIVVAPHVLSLNAAAEGNYVTVHTDIDYCMVDESSVSLTVGGEEIGIVSCYDDDRGNLVVKVYRTAVTAVARPDYATFTLTGKTDDGMTFTGTDTIRVIDVAASSKK
jgi:hypothetical protein